MKTNTIKFLVVALWCMGSISAAPANAENKVACSADVALVGEGLLIGQVLNAAGQPVVGAPVVLSSQGQEIARCHTDKRGIFQVMGLNGGAVEVASVGVTGTCRLWSPGTAPPAAQQGLLIVAEGEVVRGQHMGGTVGHGRGRARGHGGGLLAMMIEHPLVTAGAVGAAIAIPIAVSNSGSPASP
ncbi:MAG: hypothetical protein SH868_07805 [Bythopirellula sp.]|nr:hypothetical protein [Bythopirellula sp.]